MNLLSACYAAAARRRRSWYERHPQARQSLDCPVISVGNLSIGGSGKTPVVAAVARLLLGLRERPAIVSRGYGRRERGDGVLVVSDGSRVLEPVERSGDEPQMLARSIAGVPVLVCANRHLAGTLARRQFACTVVLLDDGFQHFALGRTTDVVVMPVSDLDDRVLPAGRLREPIDAASSADCLLVPGSDDDRLRVSTTFDRMPVFGVQNNYASLQGLDGPLSAAKTAVAVAGIARPERFFTALRERGLDVVRALSFPDHHWYTRRDLDRIRAVARQSAADVVVTTEKDAVRLPRQPGWAVLPMRTAIEPIAEFTAWLRDRL